MGQGHSALGFAVIESFFPADDVTEDTCRRLARPVSPPSPAARLDDA